MSADKLIFVDADGHLLEPPTALIDYGAGGVPRHGLAGAYRR